MRKRTCRTRRTSGSSTIGEETRWTRRTLGISVWTFVTSWARFTSNLQTKIKNIKSCLEKCFELPLPSKGSRRTCPWREYVPEGQSITLALDVVSGQAFPAGQTVQVAEVLPASA